MLYETIRQVLGGELSRWVQWTRPSNDFIIHVH